MATTHPELAKEWDYEKNGKLTPDMFSFGSHKKVWWKHSCGFSWKVSINNRANSGCPLCTASKGEKEIQKVLDSFSINYNTQFYIKKRGHYKDDFALFDNMNNLVGTIEYNGEQHYQPVDFAGKGEKWAKNALMKTQKRDSEKTKWLFHHGIEQLIIPYWEYDNIPTLVKAFCKKLKLI